MDLFSNLPEEMVIQICRSLEYDELVKFMQTSSTNQRICNEVLRDKRYNRIIDKMLLAVKKYSIPITEILIATKFPDMEIRLMYIDKDTYIVEDVTEGSKEISLFGPMAEEKIRQDFLRMLRSGF